MHPPYSPDLAPYIYHLFRSLQNFLDGQKLANKRAAENHVAKFFATKSQKFYTDGIMKLPEKWQKVKDNNGTYAIKCDQIGGTFSNRVLLTCHA